ncbi:MAG: dihydrolipoyl dehydrogenase [Leptospiraceae bacterium]|nr:dihydrolipoyl dehydrogenase [Leptospiraceae bacterium]
MKLNFKKISIVFLLVSLVAVARYYNIQEYLSFESLKNNRDLLNSYYAQNQGLFIVVYILIYILSVAVAIPGAAILTLAGGALFGVLTGTLVVSFASTIGASLSFLISRYLFRDTLREKFSDKLKAIDKGIRQDGAFYLFTLRMIPIFPFFLINVLMGLTDISLWVFFFVSQVGMLIGTIVYVNAGTQLASISSLKDILSPNLLLSFVALGILPLFAKSIINYLQNQKIYKNYKKPKSFDYNLIVIGAGAAGLVASYIAATVKAKVALIEKHKMGGDCLNYGCVPSKALIAVAKKVNTSKKIAEYGLKTAKFEFDFANIMERVAKVVKKIEPNDSVERYTKLGVDCFSGDAKIISPYIVSVNGKEFTTKSIVIASGAEPFVPNIPGLNEISYLTSDTLWNLKKLPKKLLVLGGGPIGCELSQAFSRLGSDVTIVEMGERIIPKEDFDVSAFMKEVFEKEDIKILTSHKAVQFKKGKTNKVVCEANGKQVEVEFDEIILAIGRKARTKGFGMEELGIRLNPNGTIETDEFLRTNFPNIFVCGDAAGPYQFTHTASHQAWYASVNSLFGIFKKFKADYSVIPWVTFTDPEVSHVGLSEMDAKEKGIEVEISQYDIGELDRAIADGEAHGFIKVLTQKGSDKILGVTIVAAHAGELLAEYVLAMKHGLGLNKILGTIHSYPTMSEANKYVAGNWKKANKPEKLLTYVEKFHTWRRK